MTWHEGDTIVVRYVRGGFVRGARPTRYVGSRNAYDALWLPAGTIVAYPVFADGTQLRDRPLAQRFTEDRAVTLQPWRGEGILMLVPQDAAHSVWIFERGWYVNLEERHRRNGRTIDTRDHVLDLWCERPRQWQWKDDDELEAAVEHRWLTRAQADEIRAEGERVARMIERWEPPFSDGWERWEPDPAWPKPALPGDWASSHGA